MVGIARRRADPHHRRPGFFMILLLSGTAACGERIEPVDQTRGAPIVVVTAPAPQFPPAPRAYASVPETERTVVETSLAATDLIYDAEGEVTTLQRAADPYRTNDSVLAETVIDPHDVAASLAAPTGTESL